MNKLKQYCFILLIIFSNKIYSQNENLKNVEYTIIAEGIDSPFPDLQIVCLRKHFNLEFLSSEFREKYDLNRQDLYKKKMLIQIFSSDKEKDGLDKIELVDIKENDKELIIRYNIINSDKNNDDINLAPFLIVQVPKSKKQFKFIVNAVEEIGVPQSIYIK